MTSYKIHILPGNFITGSRRIITFDFLSLEVYATTISKGQATAKNRIKGNLYFRLQIPFCQLKDLPTEQAKKKVAKKGSLFRVECCCGCCCSCSRHEIHEKRKASSQTKKAGALRHVWSVGVSHSLLPKVICTKYYKLLSYALPHETSSHFYVI